MAGNLDFARRSWLRRSFHPVDGHVHNGQPGQGPAIAFTGAGIIVPDSPIVALPEQTEITIGGVDTGWNTIDIGALVGGPAPGAGAKVAILNCQLHAQHVSVSADMTLAVRKSGTAPIINRDTRARYLMIGDPDDNDDSNGRTIFCPLDAAQQFDWRFVSIPSNGNGIFKINLEGWMF